MKISEDCRLEWIIDYLPARARHMLERLNYNQIIKLEVEIEKRYPNGIALSELVQMLSYNESLVLDMSGYYDED